MSHEMRTPMNAIIGMARVAEKTDDLEKLKYCLSAIGNSSQHLLGLINDILDMSKIESGKFELYLGEFDLEDMLMRLCGLITGKTEEKGISLSVAVSNDLRAGYIGDELRLAQVLTNILSNAAKFTQNGGNIGLAVDAEAGESSSLLRFKVSDNGIGMTAEQVAKVFNAFEQADTSISRRFGGTGLGLVISKSIVEKMNGRILVDSAPNQGTVFTVEVELGHAEGTEEAESMRSLDDGPEQCSGLNGRRVLAVLTDGEGSDFFRNLSERIGFSLDLASCGAEAAQLSASARDAGQAYDFVFLDYQLPDMTGITAAERLKAGGETGTMILMASFLQWNELDEEARRAGIATFVSKPLFRAAILESVQKIADNAGECPVPLGLACATPDAGRPDFSGLSLLLAEDVDINREVFCSLLEDTGISIDMAEDGRQAVDCFKAAPEKYDIIVMDLQMPGMDGFEATKLIRGLEHVRAGSIPIIAMTANVFKDDIDKCLECGMNGHLSKPIDESKVIEAIREHCGKDC